MSNVQGVAEESNRSFLNRAGSFSKLSWRRGLAI
jgi:hypothetical protein